MNKVKSNMIFIDINKFLIVFKLVIKGLFFKFL